MSTQSTTCIGRISGKPLTAYASAAEAEDGARFAQERYGAPMVPYPCDRCGWWHLSPADRQTPSSTCATCRGRDGRLKASYASQDDAERRASILHRERGVRLQAYLCAFGGWHLTKG